jgi:hypothetical protein
MKWEYLMSPFSDVVNELEWLNEKGADGWELIQIFPYGDWENSKNPQFDYYFKRAVEINAKLRAAQTGEENKDEGS